MKTAEIEKRNRYVKLRLEGLTPDEAFAEVEHVFTIIKNDNDG